MTTATTVQALAAEALEHFETRTRDDGETFIATKDGCPEWIGELVYAAHNGYVSFLPDNWRYERIRDAIAWISMLDGADDPSDSDSSNEFADDAVDVYTAARFAWLSSSLNRAGYVDDAVAEFGAEFTGIVDMIGLGQYQEAAEIYSSVLDSLEKRASV